MCKFYHGKVQVPNNPAATTKGMDLPQIDRRDTLGDGVIHLYTLGVLALLNVDRCSACHYEIGKFFTRGGSESEVQPKLRQAFPTRYNLPVRNLQRSACTSGLCAKYRADKKLRSKSTDRSPKDLEIPEFNQVPKWQFVERDKSRISRLVRTTSIN
jgi:hypothetical protein